MVRGEGRGRVFVVLFPEGLQKVKSQLADLSPGDRLYIDGQLLPLEKRAPVIALDLSAIARKTQWSVVAMAEILRHSGIYPLQAFRDAIALQPQYAEANLAVIDASLGKVISESP